MCRDNERLYLTTEGFESSATSLLDLDPTAALHPLAGPTTQRDIFIHQRAGAIAASCELSSSSFDIPACYDSKKKQKEEKEKKTHRISRTVSKSASQVMRDVEAWWRANVKKAQDCENQGDGKEAIAEDEGVNIELSSEAGGSVVSVSLDRGSRGFFASPLTRLQHLLDINEPVKTKNMEDLPKLADVMEGVKKKKNEKLKELEKQRERARGTLEERSKLPVGKQLEEGEADLHKEAQTHSRGDSEDLSVSGEYVKLEVPGVEAVRAVAAERSQRNNVDLALQGTTDAPAPAASSSNATSGDTVSTEAESFSTISTGNTTRVHHTSAIPTTPSTPAEEIIDIDEYMANLSPVPTIPSTPDPSSSLLVSPADVIADYYGSCFDDPPPDRFAPYSTYTHHTLSPSYQHQHQHRDPATATAQDANEPDPRQTSYPALDDKDATLDDFGFRPTITPAIKKRLESGDWEVDAEKWDEEEDGFEVISGELAERAGQPNDEYWVDLLGSRSPAGELQDL